MLASFSRIARFWRPHKALGFGLVITMVLRAIFTVVLALAIKVVIDQVIEPSGEMSGLTVTAFLLGGFLVSFTAGLVSARLTAKASASIIADVRTEAFDHLQDLPLSFHDRSATGDLIAHFSSDVAQLSLGVIRMPLLGLRALSAMALYLPVMFVLDWRLASISVLVIPLVVWLVYRFAPASAAALDEEKQDIADVLEEVSSNLRSQRLLRAFGLRQDSRNRFRDRVATLRHASEAAESRIAFEQVIAEYGVELAKVAIIVVGAALAFGGDLDPGTFAAFAAILTEFAYQASVFGMDVLPSIKQSEAGIRRLDALLATATPVEREDASASPTMSSPISFRDVVLSYDGTNRPALGGVTADLPGHSHIGVVGPNGSGKSSILNAILQLYDLRSGSILVDGVDLATVDLTELRARVGVAFQQTMLLDGSIRDNVVLGAASIADDALEAALRDSGLSALCARLPGGVGSEIGQGGLVLSPGDAQRIGLARALARQPELLLLDEVASSLDPESEAALVTTIEQLRHGRTIINVTHRLETVRNADVIMVLVDGSVAEIGTFADLMEADGVFESMWKKQHGFHVSGNGLRAQVHPERLQSIPIFSELPDSLLTELAERFDSRFLQSGELVIREGAWGDAFYVIARGVVEVIADLGGPTERIVAVLEDGDFFGEMALLSSVRRNASVRTRGACTILRLDQGSFSELMDSAPTTRALVEAAAVDRAAMNVSSTD